MLHADETGWRVNGKTYWLWCFASKDVTYYMIDRKRGSPALKRFFKKEFAGVLVTDFWGAYNAVVCARKQKCLPHLLRDLKRTQHYHQPGGDWPAFSKQLKRLIRDSIRLSKRRQDLSAEAFASRRRRLDERLRQLLAQPWEQRHARRLVKRLRRHAAELFTFLDHAGVPFDNNHGERQIRPAVIAQEQLRQRQRGRGRDPGDPHERVPHPQTTRPQSRLRGHRGRSHLPPNRSATASTRADH